MSVLDAVSRFSVAYYQNTQWFEITTSTGPEQAFLVNCAVADDTLTSDELTTTCETIRSEIAKLPGVSACTVTPVEFDMTDPWEHGGYPSLNFDGSWTLTGFHIESERPGKPTRFSHAWFCCSNSVIEHSVVGPSLRQHSAVSLVKGPVPRPAIGPARLV